MNNGLIREWLNGGLIPLNLCIIFIILVTLYRTYRAIGKGWTKIPGVQAACALLWIFIADLLRSSLAWSFLHSVADARMWTSPLSTFMYMTAAICATLATFRLVHVLSPKSWGHWSWIGALLFSSTFLLAAEYLHALDWFIALVKAQ